LKDLIFIEFNNSAKTAHGIYASCSMNTFFSFEPFMVYICLYVSNS